jgi:hypothetical protein
MEPDWWKRRIEECGDKAVPNLDGLNEQETAIVLLRYGMAIRMYGECAPGGFETWRAWDASTEEFLRRAER